MTPDKLAALRHCVIRDLLDRLPVASTDQTNTFIANLKLPESTRANRFLMLRVSPELAETGYRGMPARTLLDSLIRSYGDNLLHVAGFYRNAKFNRIELELPRGCAFHGYRSRLGFYNGILCQPLNRIDVYFLLSSAKFDGSKAIQLTPADRAFFEAGITV